MTAPQYTPFTTRWHPTVTEVDDSIPPKAANWNPSLEALADNVAYVRAQLGHGPAIEWRPAIQQGVIGTMGPDFGAAAWDPSVSKWIVVTLHNSVITWDAWVSAGLDGTAAAAWSQLGTAWTETAAIEFIDVSPDPTTSGDYWVSAVINGGSTYRLHVFLFTPSSWAIKHNFGSAAGQHFYGTALCAFNGYIIVATAAQDGTSAFQWSNDGGATWGAFATSMPAMPAGSGWLLKSNSVPQGLAGTGLMVLAVPQGAALGASTKVWKTTDGHTWSVAATLSFMASGENVVGLAWDPTTQLWYLALQTSTPTVYFYSSPDGIAWTAIASPPATHMTVSDMAAIAGLLVCTLADESSGGPSGQVWSPDGALTWYAGDAKLFANEVSSFAGYTRPRIVSSGQGFATWNNLWLRFSSVQGTPATSL